MNQELVGFQQHNPQWNEQYLQIEPDSSERNEGIKRYNFIEDDVYKIQERWEINVNYERLSYISMMLYWNYLGRIGFYKFIDMPQGLIPKNMELGSKEHACWLFYNSIEMRSAQKSMEVFSRYVKMHEEHPEVFDPTKIISGNVDIETVFKESGIFALADKKPYELINSWINNTKVLYEKEPNGDPRLLLKDTKNYEEVCEILDVVHKGLKEGTYFNGFGHKVASLFLSWVRQFGWADNRFPFPIPVDLHVFRSMGVTEAYKLNKGYVNHEPLRTVLRAYFYQFSKDNPSVDPRILSEAIWGLGTNLCAKNPQAKEVNDKRRYVARSGKRMSDKFSYEKTLFDEGDLSNIPKEEEYRPEPGTPIPPSPNNMYGSCPVCPISPECKKIMSSSRHYDKGKLYIERNRHVFMGPINYPLILSQEDFVVPIGAMGLYEEAR